MKYNIGDTVWWANTRMVEQWRKCPDCCGNRFLDVILGDGSQVQIACSRCETGGWNSYSAGSIKYYEHVTDCVETTINRVELSDEKSEYGVEGCYRVDERDLFANQAQAGLRVQALIEERNAEELARRFRKEKDTKTWAWNVRYHRKCIREAQRQIEYHTAKLHAAPDKYKELDKAAS